MCASAVGGWKASSDSVFDDARAAAAGFSDSGYATSIALVARLARNHGAGSTMLTPRVTSIDVVPGFRWQTNH